MTPDKKPADNWLKSDNLPRLAFAIALSPPVAGALIAIILGLTVFSSAIFMIEDPAHDSQFIPAGPVGIVFNLLMVLTGGMMLGAIIGWPVMLALGLPTHAFLLRKTSAKAWVYVVAGAVGGAAAGGLRFLSSAGFGNTNDLIQLLAIGPVTGILAALIFWIVRRPDKDAASFKA